MEKCPNELILIRHGENEVDSSKPNRDLSLSEDGVAQAKWAAETIARITLHIDSVFTSTSKRTIETAQIITRNEDTIQDDRLLERGWGNVRSDGCETYEEARFRLNGLFEELFEKYNEKNILLVTHGSLIKVAEDLLDNNTFDNNRMRKIDNCSIIKYSRMDNETSNDVGYLRWKKSIKPFDVLEKQEIISNNSTVFFVRHGESESNRDGVLAGGMDFPLTETGIYQANEVSEDLFKLNINFNKIFTSPLSRAVDTAKIIAKRCGISDDSIIVLDDLTGCGGGDLEGKSYSEWYATPVEDLVSKHGAESFMNQRKRIGRAILDVIKNTGRNNKSIVVSHSSVFQVFQALNSGIEDEEETFSQNKLKSGEYTEIIL